MIARRLTYTAANTAEIENVGISAPGSDEVLVRCHFSGISRGTEALVYGGKVPASEHDRMRCPHQSGGFNYPLSYGYACVGKVEATGKDVSNVATGDMVFVLHPHQDFFVAKAGFCTTLPDSLPPARAVLAANMETALNAVWDANLQEGENCAVLGAGVLGLLTGYLLKEIHGAEALVFDINIKKRDIVEKLGLLFSPAEPLQDEKQHDLQCIFNTSASGDGLQLALDMAGFEGRIIEMSWYGDKPVKLNLGGGFHSNCLSIISSQVGHVSKSKRHTTSHADRMRQAIAFLDNPVLDHLLEPKIDLNTLPSHLHGIFNGDGGALCQVVKYTTT